MKIKYPEIGICGLSCRLCPSYHARGESKCGGCKSRFRMAVGCPFITCAVKRKGIEFCWECAESKTCSKWRVHRRFSARHDTFVCYQRLEDNIAFIQRNGVRAFERTQLVREQLLREMLAGFNDGRSKTRYSIAATVLETEDLRRALNQAQKASAGLGLGDRALVLRSILDEIADRKKCILRLRK